MTRYCPPGPSCPPVPDASAYNALPVTGVPWCPLPNRLCRLLPSDTQKRLLWRIPAELKLLLTQFKLSTESINSECSGRSESWGSETCPAQHPWLCPGNQWVSAGTGRAGAVWVIPVASATGTGHMLEMSCVPVGHSGVRSIFQGWTCAWSRSMAASTAASARPAPSTVNATPATSSTWMGRPVPVRTLSLLFYPVAEGL